MENKEIIKFIKNELKFFTDIYGEIESNRDYTLFIRSLYNLAVNIKNQELGSPYGNSIKDIMKDKDDTYLIVKQLKNIKGSIN